MRPTWKGAVHLGLGMLRDSQGSASRPTRLRLPSSTSLEYFPRVLGTCGTCGTGGVLRDSKGVLRKDEVRVERDWFGGNRLKPRL